MPLLLLLRLPQLDSVQLVDDVDLSLRRHRLHAPDLLEAQELSSKPDLPDRLHSSGSI